MCKVTFFLRFQTTYPKIHIGQRLFESLKPFFVRLLKDRNTCCIQHTKLEELRVAPNLMRTNNIVHGNHMCECFCDVCGLDGQPCKASYDLYKGIIQIWEAMVCPKGKFNEWHKCKCLFGDCSRCGVLILPLYPKEIIGYNSNMVQWRCYALETTMARSSRPLKKLTLVYKTTSSNVFIDYMKPKFQHFVKHNFVTRQQDKHFKHCVKSLNQLILWFMQQILLKVMDLKCKMKSKVCIGIRIRCQYWYTFVSIGILPHIHMMKIHGSLRNTIFTFFMIKKMILSLFNIISNCIGNTWWTMDMHHNGPRCGVMTMHINLRVANHGILCRSI